MKYTILSLSVLSTLLFSCTTTPEKNNSQIETSNEKLDSSFVADNSKKLEISELELPKDLASLVPIDLLDVKSKNVFEKYGLEFSGNCYACDLSSLSVSNDKMIWTNVCDEADVFEVNEFSFSVEEKRTIINTLDRTYFIRKIDDAPVYEISIEGEKLEMINKRISKYFTTKQALPLFKEHDCGDFDG